MTGFTGRAVHLVRRPDGRPRPDDVALVEYTLPSPGPGQVVVRNSAMSVEPYMRGRMSESSSYVAPYELNAPMTGHAVGVVVASAAPSVPEGSTVLHELGWREHSLADVSEVEVVDTDGGIDPAAYLGVLGITGMTAWVGLTRVARVQPGETGFVSSAAGAVGAVAGQLAHAMGCPTIGSCGSAEKVALATGELGFDTAFDYHDGRARDLLAQALKDIGQDGIDVYFDNVGGEQLEAAIRVCREHARLALCGAISVYNATDPVPGPRNLLLMIWRRLRMEGFLLQDHLEVKDEFRTLMKGWLADGTVTSPETVVGRGIDQAFDGFLAMLDGATYGKALVQI